MKYTKAHMYWGPGFENLIELNLRNPGPSDGYVVKSIDGLEPPKVAISITDQVFEGGIVQGRRPDNRVIVIDLLLKPNYAAGQDVGSLRKRLYQMLSPTYEFVSFKLIDPDGNYVYTDGYVEQIEPNIFTSEPEVRITMLCNSPYFRHDLYTYPSPSDFVNDSTIPIFNEGDAKMGFLANFKLTSASSYFRIYNDNSTKQIRFDYAFLANDQVWIDTRAGFRSAVRVRSGVANLNLLPYMTSASTWIEAGGGASVIRPTPLTYQLLSLQYTSRHWGF